MKKFRIASMEVGRNAFYFLAVKNVGHAATTGPITVTDNLPAGMNLVSASGTGWDCSATRGRRVTCTCPGPLAPGATLADVAIKVFIEGPAGALITNSARVSTPGDENPVNDTSSDTDYFNQPC